MSVPKTPLACAAVCGVLAAAIFLPGLGDHGVWSTGELPVLDRTRAELGTALRGLVRSPWLPDAIRTFGYEIAGVAGARLVHALAVAALVAIAALLARRRGASTPIAIAAGLFALAFPVAIHSARTLLGNPIGELLGVLAVLAGLRALTVDRLRLFFVGFAALALAAAIASLGILLGGALPLAVLAAACTRDAKRSIRFSLWILTAIALGIALVLALEQGEGYIPLLGASKDLAIAAKPQDRRFTSGLQEAGYQLYPWLPLVVLGALANARDRWPAIWLALAVVASAAWSIVYGPSAVPMIVPAALCASAAIERLTDPDAAPAWRRVLVLGGLLAILVMAKDAERVPSRVAAPLVAFLGEHTFPGDELSERAPLDGLRRGAFFALLFAGLLSTRRGRLGRALDRLPETARAWLPAGAIGLAALHGAWIQARTVVPALSQLLSPKDVLDRWHVLADRGTVSTELAVHRLRDEGLGFYGPESPRKLLGRNDVIAWLQDAEPRAVLMRERDVAPVYQKLREAGQPMHVLDASHQHLRLVTNVLPSDATDVNAIPTVLFTEPPQLRHETRLGFAGAIEIIGWEVTDPIVRGREVTLRLAIEVRRPLPAGAKIYARFLKGRSSRLNGDPVSLTGEIYPPNLWRAGDYILHEQTFEAPWLEITPGPHEFFIGLRRHEGENFAIDVPEGKTGEHGVRVRGKSRNFATIGEVEVW